MESDISSLHIAVLSGGPGSERKVSQASAASVVEALGPHAGKVTLVDVTGPDFQLPDNTDLAFNVIHGTFGEDGELQQILEARGVPYTGAGVDSSRLAFDKALSKEQFIEAGVRTPRSALMQVSEVTEPPFGIPCVVKPPREGSSVGVHIVEDEPAWSAAIADAKKYGSDTLIEDYVKGKELTVGILDGQALPIVHIQPKSGFYDINNKYPWMNQTGGTDYFCPADLPVEITDAVQAEAVKAHQSLGIEVYSRVDLLLNEAGLPFVLEVNTIPGMTSSSLLPKAARAVGMEFDALCFRIAEISLNLRKNP